MIVDTNTPMLLAGQSVTSIRQHRGKVKRNLLGQTGYERGRLNGLEETPDYWAER